MKIKHFFGLAVIAAMTASCSSNEDLGTAGPGTGTNEAGASYASITIDLPTTRGTRAEIDNFDGGTASEYAVNDATLLIFKKVGTSENDYTFVEKADLGNLEPWKMLRQPIRVSPLKQLSQLSSKKLPLVKVAITMLWLSLTIKIRITKTRSVCLVLLTHMELGMPQQR